MFVKTQTITDQAISPQRKKYKKNMFTFNSENKIQDVKQKFNIQSS